MAWTKYQLLLAFVMVITGSINTLSTKWADGISAEGRKGSGSHPFDHPFFQASTMFVGEMLCLLTFKILYKIYSLREDGSEDVKELTKGNRNFNPFILFFPAMCDMTATSIMYIGLNLTYASSFQMFRGSVIIFVGLLSVGFLERILKNREWIGIFAVIIGLGVVGVADFIAKDDAEDHNKNDIITGDLLIVIAQIITAIQMVVEEKFVTGLDIPPLQAIGWEGVFGFSVLGLLQIPFYYIKAGKPFTNNPRGTLEDTVDAFIQMGNSWQLVFAILGTVISIAFFNFAGISVTKEMSATTRMVLDSVRTILIWMVSLMFLGQKFHWLQLLGFIALVYGMCIYNNITCTLLFVKLHSLIVRIRYRNMDEESIIENRTADLPDDSTPA